MQRRRSRSKSRRKNRAAASIPTSITVVNNNNDDEQAQESMNIKSKKSKSNREIKKRGTTGDTEKPKGKTQIEILRENLINESMRAIERKQKLRVSSHSYSRSSSLPTNNDLDNKLTTVKRKPPKQNDSDNHNLLLENNLSSHSSKAEQSRVSSYSTKSTRSFTSVSNRTVQSTQSGESDYVDVDQQDLWENKSNHSPKSRRSGAFPSKSARSFGGVSDRSIDSRKSHTIQNEENEDESKDVQDKSSRYNEKKLDSSHYLREQLMKESMRAIDRKQKQARLQCRKASSRTKSDSASDFDILMKKSIKQHSTKFVPPTTTEHDQSNSLSDPTSSDSRSRSKVNRPTSERWRKKDLTITSTTSLKRSKSFSSKRSNNYSTSTIESPKKSTTISPKRSKSFSSKRSNNSSTSTIESPKKSTTTSPKRSKSFSLKRSNNSSISTIESPKKSTTTSPKRSRSFSSKRSKAASSSSTCQKESAENVDTEILTGETKSSSWRNMWSKSRGRSKSRSRSKSKTPTHSVKASNDSLDISREADSENSGDTDGKAELETRSEDSNCIVKSMIDDVGNELAWHHAIMRHDWDVIIEMLECYDHNKFRKNRSTAVANRKPRVLKYFHANEVSQQQQISPLLYVDSKGRTPLHWACIEHMPSKLLLRLLFVERNAASIKDKDGRYPLHLAALHNLHEPILDRLIRAYPKCLGVPDHLGHTPIQHATVRADRCRPKNEEGTWNAPTTKEQAAWQNIMRRAYENVEFILRTMVTRGKSLSIVHEGQIVIESVEILAPPGVVNLMVILGEKILQKYKTMSKRLLDLVFQLNYPLNVIHRVLEKASKTIPPLALLEVTRQKLIDHYDGGFINISREGSIEEASSCFAKEVASSFSKGLQDEGSNISPAGGEWFDKLRYLVGRSSNQPNNTAKKTLLHTALTNPQSPPSLIEYLCRLNPAARYENNDNALPIHLACIHWYPETCGAEKESSCTKVLNLLLAGDFGLVLREYHGRIALHYAILNDKALPCIETILNLDRETALIPDPDTRLLPFQLAAISDKPNGSSPTSVRCNSVRSTRQLEVIYNLLRTNPQAISPFDGNIDPEIEIFR